MLNPIRYEAKIRIDDVPIQWIPMFELYYPDLPQFPIIYIHTFLDNNRIYGFPAYVSFDIINDKKCNVNILFLCNEDLERKNKYKSLIIKELKQRFGIEEKISLNDIINCCNGNKVYEDFFRELWNYSKKIYGDFIPYGRFYEEIFSIVRFVSAWQPKTGRQSEMRMLYNFLSIFGEEIRILGKWNFLHFYLLPTYQDLSNDNLNDFKKFSKLYKIIKKIWEYYYTDSKMIMDCRFPSMEQSWPQNKEDFIRKVSSKLFEEEIINLEEKLNLERLVDAFNRHPWRTAFFIYSIMISKIKDYKTWDKDFFIEFYTSKIGIGNSPKVIACILQQGFKNPEVIPIDTWVQSFYEGALDIKEKRDFLNKFSNLGKLERLIWKLSQAKKTNIKVCFNILWCIRFGDIGNNELRGANPIACYECRLVQKCPGFGGINNKKVLIVEHKNIELVKKKTVYF